MFEGRSAASRTPRLETLMAEKKKDLPRKVVADNRRARFDYDIGEVIEAGVALTGTEVKSLRNGKATIHESYAAGKDGELWLYNSYISEYLEANRFNHEPRRPRKLLLHRRELNELAGGITRGGYTVIPTQLYLSRGRAKLELALARGKRKHDKRQELADRDAQREVERALRGKRVLR